MKKLIGVIGIIVGIYVGVYLSLYVCFIGGLFDIVKGLFAFSAIGVVIGIVKVMISSIIGYFSAFAIIFPSALLFREQK